MFRYSIRTKLIILLLFITVIPFGSSILLTYKLTIQSLKETAIEENARLLFQSKSSFQSYLEGLNRLTLSIYKNPDSTIWLKSGISNHNFTNLSQLQEFLSTMFHFNDDIEQVYLYLANSNQAFSISSRYIFNAKTIEFKLTDILNKTMENPYNTYVQGPHTMDYYGLEQGKFFDRERVITFHRMLINPNKKFQGILSIDFSTDTIYALSKKIFSEDVESFYLVNREGHIFFPETRDNGKLKLNDKWFQMIKESGQEQGNFSWNTDVFQGIIIYETLPQSLGGLYLIKQIPFHQLYIDANEIVKLNILIGAMVLILVVLATFFVSFKITSPIRVLTRNIQRIENGDMQIDFESLGRDEIGVLGYRFKSMIETIKNLIMQEYRLELQNKTNQLKVLQSQVNPHFLNNALQTIGSVAVDRGVPEVYKLIRSLAQIMRYSMETDEDLVPLSRELEIVKAYLKLQKERFDDRLAIEWQVSEETKQRMIPRMILQPLVENYFKHGFEMGEKGGYLKIIAELTKQDTLRLVVVDNGPGIEPSRLKEILEELHDSNVKRELSGIGLGNVYRRLQLYFQDQVSFYLQNLEGRGFMVEVTIPSIHGGEISEGNFSR